MPKNNSKRSPIKDLPVHTPGQSLRDQWESLLNDKVLPPFFLAGVAIILAMLEWYRYWTNAKPSPWLYTILAILAVLFAAWKIWKLLPVARALSQGQRGEEAVGQYLEEKLRPHGFHILHDIPGNNFNVDHVVIGPTGIFTIETKTVSKPAKGECKIRYNGEQIIINGGVETNEPLIQAKAQSSWLAEQIEQSTGKKFFVQPIVLYPGWYVDNAALGSPVWVFNEKASISFIKKAKHHHLAPEDGSLVTYHLKKIVLAASRS